MSSPWTGLSAASAAVVMTVLAVSLLDGEAAPRPTPTQEPEEKNLWFQRDDELDWITSELDPFQRGNRKGKRRKGPPDGRRGDTFQRRRRGRQ